MGEVPVQVQAQGPQGLGVLLGPLALVCSTLLSFGNFYNIEIYIISDISTNYGLIFFNSLPCRCHGIHYLLLLRRSLALLYPDSEDSSLEKVE